MTYSKLTIETLEQRCEICLKLTIKTPKRRHCRSFGVFIVNFEHFSHLYSSVSIVNFEQINARWEKRDHKKTKIRKNDSLINVFHCLFVDYGQRTGNFNLHGFCIF